MRKMIATLLLLALMNPIVTFARDNRGFVGHGGGGYAYHGYYGHPYSWGPHAGYRWGWYGGGWGWWPLAVFGGLAAGAALAAPYAYSYPPYSYAPYSVPQYQPRWCQGPYGLYAC